MNISIFFPLPSINSQTHYRHTRDDRERKGRGGAEDHHLQLKPGAVQTLNLPYACFRKKNAKVQLKAIACTAAPSKFS